MIGRVLAGRYELDGVLGQGGMAVVHRAMDRTLGREVAVKVLREQYASDPEFVERFGREARSAARLSHPNVVDIFDVGSEGNTHFIVMELVEGENLKSLVRRGGPLPPALVMRFGREIASALGYAHRRGLIHRDVKPQNMLVDDHGHAKLADFGIAQAAETVSMTETGTVLGTAQYMAPEQARGQPVTPATDVYSLGVVLYELATGRLPFEGGSPLAVALRHVQEQPTPPRRLNPGLPPELEAIILQAMAKDPARRFSSAAALAEALARGPNPIAERTARVAPVPAGGSRPPNGARRPGGRDQRTTHQPTVASQRTARQPVAPTATSPGRRGPSGRSASGGRRPGGAPAGIAAARPPARGGAIVLILLLLASLGALLLGFSWLFGASRPAPAPQPTATAAVVVANTPTSVPPTATRPPPTATAVPPTAAPTATRVPPTATAVPTAPPTPRVVTVVAPKLVGLTLAAAQQEVAARNLIMDFREGNDPRQPDGVVIDQAPKEGEAVAPRSVVRVVVNRLAAGMLVTVPSVLGEEAGKARKTLEDAGLKVTVESINRGSNGVVNDQSPEPGAKVPPGTTVKIAVGR